MSAQASPVRWNAADPSAFVPAALLGPDGRYACDCCDALIARAELVALTHGFFCAECAQDEGAQA